MIRRYLFQLQRMKEQENKSGDLASIQFQRQQQLIQQLTSQNAPTDSLEPKSPPKKKGLSSLLLPPSARKQIIKDATNEEKIKNKPVLKRIVEIEENKEEEFTDKTERDIKDLHLRELYKVDEELDDFSINISSGRSSFRSTEYEELDRTL